MNNKTKENKLFDEYINNKQLPRQGFGNAFNYFSKLTPTKKRFLTKTRDSIIRSMGVTFRVYDNNKLIDRDWPLDLMPRIIKEKEWKEVKEGLIQRIKAVNLFIHDKSFVFLKGTKLDFVKKNLNQELVFLNPNVSAECGCGESFNFDNELVKDLSNN